MSRIINGTINVPSFDPTGNPGEYTFTNATFASQSDISGNGAFLLATGFLIYVPASDPNTFLQIPGTVHRYRITDLQILDSATVSGTLIWNEDGDEFDAPTAGVDAIISASSPNLNYGLPVDPALYTTLPPGAATGAYNVDILSIMDMQPTGEPKFVFTQSVDATQWDVVHNKNSSDFIYTLFDASGAQIIPDNIIAVSENEIQLNVLAPMQGKLVLLFV